MGNTELCLLLLLGACALAQQGSENADEQTPTCLLATRFRAFKKYVYQYSTESLNGVTGTANLRNGPKVTCQVEVEVPRPCSFILRTADCALSEVSVIDPQGQPMYRQAAGAEAFQAAMERNLLKFSVGRVTDVELFPEADEPVNILNIKRGIISALMVPVMEEQHNSYMSTVHGVCKTEFTVNAMKDIATDVSLSRDLADCDLFYPRPLPSSRLALHPSLHEPLSQLIRSRQECNYQFDNRRKHLTAAQCTETHVYLPFSHGDNGISSVVTQSLTLQESAKIDNRQFEVDPMKVKFLTMEDPEDKAPVQTKDATLTTLRDLSGLSGTDQGERRAGLFHKLVSELRGLKNQTLSPAVDEMLQVSAMLTVQALAQCGTPECTSAILSVVRTRDGVAAVEVDALVYALALQARTDSHLVRDMLSMAQHKQSKAIMYALANTVKSHTTQEELLTPEVSEVAEFMDTLLGDCSENEDTTFLTLRVIGVMGKAMQDASPSLKSSLLTCVRQPAASPSVQKAAVQALRLMVIDEEVRKTLLEVYQDGQSPVQTRVAAYLLLMQSPDQALVTEVVNTLEGQDHQVRAFVLTHLNNIHSSPDPEMEQTRQYIDAAMHDTSDTGSPTMSRNYRMDTSMGPIQGNVIFDGTGFVPKEAMLKTTLTAFGYNLDMLEVGVEGNAFEPSLEALFGRNGFFPGSVSKALYWASDQMPDSLRSNRKKRQAPQDLLMDIGQNFQKLIKELRSQDAPEAMAYLRLLGDELGYLKTSELEHLAQTLLTYSHILFRDRPAQALKSLLTSTDNELFAHYMFLDEAFVLSSASGFPLKLALSGVFTPGAKGGLKLSPGMQLSFMPSVGVEFITQMGIHVPEFVVAGIEMHTNMYHESSLEAKVTISRNQIKLSLPAPKANTQLFTVSNKVLSVSSTQAKIVPSLVEGRTDSSDCQTLFTGLKYCTTLRYSNASSIEDAPHYPLTGETRLAVEVQPTGEVSEYTAALSRDAAKGRQKVDILKLTLRAEGAAPTEATATLKYNWNKNTITTELQAPDYDLEAGVRMTLTDTKVKGKTMRGLTLDVTNRNIPQLSLVGRARLDQMTDGLLQIQMTVPSLNADASATATLKKAEGLVLHLETGLNLPETSSLQKLSMKYDDNKFEVEIKSDLNSDIEKLIPDAEHYRRRLQEVIDDVLEQKVAKTDMKLRHIVTKGIEAVNIWLDKVAAGNPYVEIIRTKRSVPELTLPTIPEKLFLQSDSFFRYQFNKNKLAISLPVLLGGKSSKDLNIPTTLSVPLISLPEIGLRIPASDFQIPTFTIPRSFDFMLPLIGLGEVYSKVNSNFYSWEGTVSGGNNTVDVPSYVAQYKVMALSPISPLSYRIEGTGMISGTIKENLKYLVNGSINHNLLDASFSLSETLSVTDKLSARANYKIECSGPLGLHTNLYYNAQAASTAEEVTGDGILDGTIKVGSLSASSIYKHNYAIRTLAREGKGESSLIVNSPLIKIHNTINGVYANAELSIVSKTNVQNDALKHVGELKYKDAQLSLKSDAVATVIGKTLRNKAEMGISSAVALLRVESQADDATDRAYSLLTGSVNSRSLELNSEASLTFKYGRGLHKATVTVNRNYLVTSGTNTLQCSPVTFENVFNGALDSSGASLSSTSKGTVQEDSRGELTVEGRISSTEAYLNSVFKGNVHDANARNTMNLAVNRQGLTYLHKMSGSLKKMKTDNSHSLTVTLWTLALHSKTDNCLSEEVSYKHDIMVDMKPFVTSMNVKKDLKFFDLKLNEVGLMKLEFFKLDLSGSLSTVGEKHELIHTYEINYADLAGALKCSTTAIVADVKMSHSCEVEFAGLSSISHCEARIYSEPFRFDSDVRTMVQPFSVTVNLITNSDGEANVCGKHTGQLYSKWLVKAEPLALAYSHDYKVSSKHLLESNSLLGSAAHQETTGILDGLLTPSDQSWTWKTKSKLNSHAYNQDINAYNNAERVGIEFAGIVFTNLLNKVGKGRERRSDMGNKEFSVSGFLKYDKNSDSHVIELPFIESLPVAFEHIKTATVNFLESLQQFINSLDISRLIGELEANLDQLPQRVRDYMAEMVLESKVNEVKETLVYLTKEFAVTLDDLESSVEKLKINVEKTLIDIASRIRDVIAAVKGHVERGDLSATISNILSQIGEAVKAFDEKYEIRQTIVRAIDAMEDIIRQIDLQKLRDSSVAWLQDLDAKYEILTKLQEKMSQLKKVIETFDVAMFFQDCGDYVLSNVSKYVEQLSTTIPTEDMAWVLESMQDVIVNWIEEYDIANKINSVYSKIRDLFLRYDIDKKIELLMDQVVVLVKEFRIQDTIQSLVDALRSINFEFAYDKVMQLLDIVVNQLKAIDFKQSIDEINENISSVLKALKTFDYNQFVDDANQKISELTRYINEQIKAYGIAQKIEAMQGFIREIQSSIIKYIEQLKGTKVAEIIKILKDVIDTTVYNDIKIKVQEILEDMRQRVIGMDIRDEMFIYLQRASESYTNMIAYISVQFNRLIEEIRKLAKNHEIINQISQAVDGVLNALKSAEMEIPSFVVPLTDLVIPSFQINLNRLQDMTIPAQISVPEFTILTLYTVPAFTIDFEEIKAKMVAFIDRIREYEFPMIEPMDIFGDLRVLYLPDLLPDLTFPEITLSEIKFPVINIPKLNLENFHITMLPIPMIMLPRVPSEVQIGAFGKLYGEFRVNSPYYTFMTEAALKNSTTTAKTPQFTASLSSQAKSTIKFLEFSLDATAHLEAPRMKKLVFTEIVKAVHMAFSIDHEGSLTFSGPSAGKTAKRSLTPSGPSVEATAKTTARATTEMYTADLVNNLALSLKSGIFASMDTTYNHNLNLPTVETSSQATMTQTAAASLESGTISVTVETIGSGKWSFQDSSNDVTHNSNLEFNINVGTAKLTFVGETNSKAVKMKQTLTAESVIFSHITVEAKAETVLPFVKSSIMVLNGEAHVGDLKIVLTASHNAELIGRMSGTISNSLEFLAHPFEIIFDSKNKGNSKIILPLKLTGKVDLQNDYGVILNSEMQRACWAGLARFNQYKYYHNFTMENNQQDIGIYAAMNGEANLDFLTVPLSIPEMTVPYLEIKTPDIKEFSLWEQAGLKNLLTNPRQSFDMNLKLQYQKNPDMQAIDLDLEPIYDAINENADVLRAYFEFGRDKVVAVLKNSYYKAKKQYNKHKIDTSSQPPKIFRVPGYKVPILNIEISAFRAEMPAFSFFIPKEVSTPSFKVPAMGFSVPSYTLVLPSLELPVLHVPETLSELTLPTFKLPSIQNNIMIPTMGNITYDFSFKSTVITLTANAGIYNQSDIVAKFGAVSSSVFDILKGKIDGTTSLTQKRGLKLATTLSLEHAQVEGSHDCTVSLSKKNMEASFATTARVDLPYISLELNQELLGNTKTKPNVASKLKLKYRFTIPLIEASGKGDVDHHLALEGLTSYVSLETSTKGKMEMTVLGSGVRSRRSSGSLSSDLAGSLENEASFYLNANGLRSTVKTNLNSNIAADGESIFNMNMNKNLALEASLRRVYTTLTFTSNNDAVIAYLNTNGKHMVKATLDFVPLTTLTANVEIDASQKSNFGDAGIVEKINIDITADKQSLIWSCKEQLASALHTCHFLLSNDEAEVRLEAALSQSADGQLTFLKSVKLPVYQKTLWDVLKLDQVTFEDKLQFFNVSTIVVYTKNKEGIVFAIPSKLFENGVTFSIPEWTIAVPAWVKEIPQAIRKIDMRFEHMNIPDQVSVPPVISVASFDLPFTTLHVPDFTIDFKNLHIPKVITTTGFDIMLPGLPRVGIPSLTIDTEYLQDKMSYLLVKLPQYVITVSSFTLPKSFTIGEYTINLDELPTITIPEQKIDIPEVALNLPASVFLPSFGALSATVAFSSPIYQLTSTMNLENRDSSLVTSLKSTCTSTMIFLEYDLDATATLRLENGAVSLNGKCLLVHSDINIDWQHVFAQNLRFKRQASPDAVVSRHMLNVDVTSPTFTHVSFRYASRKDGITASVSSPSAGFLGVALQRRSPSQMYGKMFSRYLSTPDKDTDILSIKATLKNSEKFILQTVWSLDVLHQFIEGSKERMPAITGALRKFINKYHNAHFGYDVNRASMKLKNSVSNVIERVYHEVPMTFDKMQFSIDELSDQGREMLKNAADSLQAITISEQDIQVRFDAVLTFLDKTKFTLPGFEERLTGHELYQKVLTAIEQASQGFSNLMETLTENSVNYIRGMDFTIPGYNGVVRGRDILDNLRSAMDSIRQEGMGWRDVSLETLVQRVSDFLQLCFQKANEAIASLKIENLDGVYTEARNARKRAAEYKDRAKMKIQEAYNEMTMERMNNDLNFLISIFQSHLYGGLNEFIDLMRQASQSTAPYIRVSSKKVDIEVPLPFLWKSFSEWPAQM